jgi:predicted nucleic acid-binding protein
MRKTIISDASCFIVLSNIGEMELLHSLYSNVVTTPEIADEFGEKLPEWVIVSTVKDMTCQQVLELQIDKGESSAIALALETSDSVLILDDYKARKVAQSLNLSYIGTIGVIIKAKLSGIIPSVKPILNKMKATNFRLSIELEREALLAAKEY